VRETVPDTVFDKDDEIVSGGLPPTSCSSGSSKERLNVQTPRPCEIVDNFFRPQNRTACAS